PGPRVLGGGARRAAFGRPVTAHRHRPGLAPAPPPPDPRRGHLAPGLRVGALRPGGLRPRGAGPDRIPDRAPALDALECRQDRGLRERNDRAGGPARGAAPERGDLSPAVPAAAAAGA